MAALTWPGDRLVPARVNRFHLASGHSFATLVRLTSWRVVWAIAFRWSPEFLHAWRRSLLRLFGARIGRGSRIYPSAWVLAPWHLVMGDASCLGRHATCHSVGRVTLGDHATVCQHGYLCAASRDIEDPRFPLIPAPITIGHSAWIATGAFVGPGVVVGEGAVVGARACAFSEVPPWTVVVGNPARILKPRRLRAIAA